MSKKSIIYIEDLKELAEDWNRFSCRPTIRKMKIGEVIDENQSVKWNKEQVIKNNDEYERQVKMLNTEKNNRLTKFQELCYSYIIQETGVSMQTAKKIYWYIYQEKHAFGLIEAIASLDDLLEIFKD